LPFFPYIFSLHLFFSCQKSFENIKIEEKTKGLKELENLKGGGKKKQNEPRNRIIKLNCINDKAYGVHILNTFLANQGTFLPKPF
jgi:hypothetical protein